MFESIFKTVIKIKLEYTIIEKFYWNKLVYVTQVHFNSCRNIAYVLKIFSKINFQSVKTFLTVFYSKFLKHLVKFKTTKFVKFILKHYILSFEIPDETLSSIYNGFV